MSEEPTYRPLERDEWWDEVRIRTIPKFNATRPWNEWLNTVEVSLVRKNHVLYSKEFRTMAEAAAWVPWAVATVRETEGVDMPKNQDYCAQSGCAEKATVFYMLRHLYNSEQSLMQIQYPTYRGFCEGHSERGYTNPEDSDENYVQFEGAFPTFDTDRDDKLYPSWYGWTVDLIGSRRESFF